MYNLDDLEKARRNFEYLSDLWSKEYTKNKPNKYDKEAKLASEHLHEVEEYLKLNGLLVYTDDELVQDSLNEKYPLAKSGEIITFNEVRYQKRFHPGKRSKSGKTVKEWHSEWVNLDIDF